MVLDRGEIRHFIGKTTQIYAKLCLDLAFSSFLSRIWSANLKNVYKVCNY